MRALAKVICPPLHNLSLPTTSNLIQQLVSTNNPDKVIFVGEALVGNEAVDQLSKFDKALKNFSAASGAGRGRGIDGMLVTKWDTVDDKVSAYPAVFCAMLLKSFLMIGWSRAKHDLCYWTAHTFRRHRTGIVDTILAAKRALIYVANS